MHHFPGRSELLVAALGHVFARLAHETAAAVAGIEDRENRAAALIDVLWELHKGPTFVAWLEVALAARADPELAERMALLQEQFTATVADQFGRLFGGAGSGVGAAGAAAVFALLQGLAVQRLVPGAPDVSTMVLDTAKALAALFIPPEPASRRRT
jgi:AcrR family transcriptional regulator